MRIFACECGATLFFDNSRCLSCGRSLGFVPGSRELVAFEDGDDPVAATSSGDHRRCANYAREGVCNWLVPVDSAETFCRACRLNAGIPDLSLPENRLRWKETESAKRRLLFGLDTLGLPLVASADDPATGVSFDLRTSTSDEHVITGHSGGLITLDAREADPEIREKVRASFEERYRTLLGHFRHEIGHHYWDRLIRDTGRFEECREVFGDERADYAAALAAHYAKAPSSDHVADFISHYAASHPWEDFAETFAHVLHIADTLETAAAHGFAPPFDPRSDFEGRMHAWYRLTVALNSLNRSMGLPDAYPFSISDAVKSKLAFVDRVIAEASGSPPS